MMSKRRNNNPPDEDLIDLLKLYETKKYKDAEIFAITISKKYPNHSFSWKVLGSIYNEIGRSSDSLNANQMAIKINPNDHEVYNISGIIYQKLNRFFEAEECFKKALLLNPRYIEAHNNLGVIQQITGRLNDAKNSYKEAIKLNSGYAEAHYNLGNIYKEYGRLDKSINSYKKAINLKPNYPEAFCNLGVVYQKTGNFEGAEESYNQAIKLKANYSTALINRSKLFFKKRDFNTSLKDADSCNTDESRICSLENLYALGRIDEIYKRIDKYSKIDEKNIRVSSFAAFISEKEKKNVANNFCLDPLSFLYFNNLSSCIKDSGKFISDFTKDIYELKADWEPETKTTSRGFQTPNNINLFKNSLHTISKIKYIILEELDKYYLKFKNKKCLFIEDWPLKKNLYGWHVILKKGGYQNPHIHPNGWLSGVIYLKVVPSLKKSEGSIEFSLNGENYSHPSSPKFIYQPNNGDIVLFPSSLHHRTTSFTSDLDRVIFSFDLMPE